MVEVDTITGLIPTFEVSEPTFCKVDKYELYELPSGTIYGAIETPFIFDTATGSLKVDLSLGEIDKELKIRAIRGSKFLDSDSFSVKSYVVNPTIDKSTCPDLILS